MTSPKSPAINARVSGQMPDWVSNLAAAMTAFAQQAEEGNPTAAFGQLATLLASLRHASNDQITPNRAREWAQWTGSAIWPRLAAAIMLLLRRSGPPLPLPVVLALAEHKEELEACCVLGGLMLEDAVLDATIQQRPDAIALSLALLPLDRLPAPLLQFAPDANLENLFQLVLACLTERAVLTTAGEFNRTLLLQVFNRFGNCRLQEPMLLRANKAWMFCSYAPWQGKHEVKRVLNTLFRHLLDEYQILPPLPQPPLRQKPLLLLVAEIIRPGHAMDRCFRNRLALLRQDFTVVLASTPQQLATIRQTEYDDCLPVLPQLRDTIDAIQRLAPDVIYYPSVGMTPWAMLFANLRLAPLQLLSGGHPATTMSPVMDYFLLAKTSAWQEGVFSEVVVTQLQDNAFRPHEKFDTGLLAAPASKDKAWVDIAINARSFKLNALVLGLCRQLIERSPVPLRFHFMPGERGLRHAGLEKRLQELLPGSSVYPEMHYMDYMRNLQRCDLALATFPFGNSNGTVDAALLGIPTVALLGAQPHAQTDWRLLSRLGLARELVATSLEQYLNLALRLITDRTALAALRARLGPARVEQCVYRDQPESGVPDFSQSLLWLYRNHAAIQASGRRHVAIGDTFGEPDAAPTPTP